MLQTKLVECIPHVAGLNPKAFRLVFGHTQSILNLALCHPHSDDVIDKFALVNFKLTACMITTPYQDTNRIIIVMHNHKMITNELLKRKHMIVLIVPALL